MENFLTNVHFLKDSLLKKVILMCIFVICFCAAAIANPSNYQTAADQPRTVTGKVAGADGISLPGVTIAIKGTSQGTITDVDGNYSLPNVSENAVLVFSFVGMRTREISVGNQTVINVSMEEETIGIEEVVAVGYGTQRRKDLTGSITSVKGDEILQPSVLSFDQMLQGKAAGVEITQTSGAPGGNVNVLVRGVSSISGGNQPLYVIDGFPIGSGGGGSDWNIGGALFEPGSMANLAQTRINPLSTINPSDIESIEILKDASATAIYGSRGANGVILITTKRGATGKHEINVDVSYGVQKANKIEMMNAREYAEYVAEGRDNAYVFSTGGDPSDPNEMRPVSQRVRPEFRNPGSITTDTDWQDEIFRIAPVQNYQVSAYTGTQNTNFFFSGGYFDQEGVVITSSLKRFNLRANVDSRVTDWVRIGSSISGSHGYGRFPMTEGHYGLGGILTNALSASPTIPMYDENGDYYFDQADVTDGLGFLRNPVQVAREGYFDNRKISDFVANNYIEVRIMEGLNFKASAGINYSQNTIKLWRTSIVPRYTNLNYPATGAATKMETLNWLNENTLNFRRLFNNVHLIDALIGFTAQKSSHDRLSAGAGDFANEYVPYIAAGIVNSGTHTVSEWSMLSLLSRVNYSYDGRYLLTATLRRDGSSRFGTSNKWGTFPSLSIGWNVSEESFMDNSDVMSTLRLKFSHGFSGNNEIGNYTHIALLGTTEYIVDGKRTQGIVQSGLANDNLTWEKSRQTNLGLEFGLFNDRVYLTSDVYYDFKTNLLLNVNLPAASGFNASMQNIGDIENKGLEIGLRTANIKTNNFQWTSNFTLSANRNKVLKLAVEDGRITHGADQITQEGYPIASFYLLKATGIFQNWEEVESSALQHPRVQPGDTKFEDVSKDGVITAEDKTIVGDPWPDFVWGFENRFTFGNLSLGISLNGVRGGHTLFDAGTTVYGMTGVQNMIARGNNRWRSEEEPGDGVTPRAIRNNYAYGFSINSRFLFDMTFTRIKNVNLTYQLPQRIVSRMNMKGLTVYADIANLYTFTDYPGYDPQSSSSGDNITNAGRDNLTYPFPTTYTFGIRLTIN